MAVLSVVGLIAGGVLALAITEHLSLGDSLYRTLLILLTRDNHYEYTTTASRVVVIILILASLAVIAYLLKWFADYIIGLGDNVWKFAVNTRVDRLKGHYIICGYGRVGSQVAKELHAEGVPFVALDRDKDKVNEALEAGYVALNLDSTEEHSLRQAKIDRAVGLVAALAEDSSNLLVTLTAKAVNPKLLIVARANRQENEIKLKRAGADLVALPYQIGGYHMASMVLRPNVVDYMDVSDKNGIARLEVEEVVVSDKSRLAGQRIGKDLTSGHLGATVLAINGADGSSRLRPDGSEVVYPGDRLILVGGKKDLANAANLIQ